MVLIISDNVNVTCGIRGSGILPVPYRSGSEKEEDFYSFTLAESVMHGEKDIKLTLAVHWRSNYWPLVYMFT